MLAGPNLVGGSKKALYILKSVQAHMCKIDVTT